MSVPLYLVDAFADRAFEGNPAAVCLLERPADASWMQAVAAEMNLSETAFLIPNANGYHLRWFTPALEVDLCGHATLASAHILWNEGYASLERDLVFTTRSGALTARRRFDEIELDFPSEPAFATEPAPKLLSALGIARASFVGKNRMDYLVEVESEAQLRSLKPQAAVLATIACRGVIVTAASDRPAFDFVSRFFAPQAGIDEDPVTGSAHCCLGPYWSEKLGKVSLQGWQASARGGRVSVTVAGDRTLLAGRATTVVRGVLVGGVVNTLGRPP